MTDINRVMAQAEASRRWPEDDPALNRWDGLTIDARRSYLVQRQAFEAGAEWALRNRDNE